MCWARMRIFWEENCLALKLTGNLKDGTELEGEDVIVIRKKSGRRPE